MLLLTLRLEDVEPRLREIEQDMGTETSDDIAAHIAVIRAYLARQRRDPETSIRLSKGILDAMGDRAQERHPQAYLGIVFNLAYAYHLKGDLIRAKPAFEEALEISEIAGSVTMLQTAASGLATLYAVGGQLRRAVEICRRGLALAEREAERSGEPIAASSYVHVALADLLREQNEIVESGFHLERGLELASRFRMGETVCDGYICLARLRQAKGEFSAALEALGRAEQLPEVCRSVQRSAGPLAANRALLALARCRVDPPDLQEARIGAVMQWAEGRGLKEEEPPATIDDEFEHLVLARVLMATGEPRRVVTTLSRLIRRAEAEGRMGRVIEILALLALAQWLADDVKSALAALQRALSLAEPEGYFRLFVDEGAPMNSLLRIASSRGIAPGYCAGLLEGFGREANDQGAEIIEPLSDRELEVLRLIAARVRGPEIAGRLFVSLNTVKTHIRNIYGKLDVHSRHEAVEVAKQLKLIP
jgi:LuxR family maltose regulon positive regulatory protein